MTFRTTFKDFKRSTRFVLTGSFLLGLLLLIAFTLNDLGFDLKFGPYDPKPHWLKQFNAEWFSSHAYIPNILAGFTGFLIGAPVAVVVLATFTIQREEKVAQTAARRRAEIAWHTFSTAIAELCNDQRIWALTTGMNELEFIQDRALKAVNNYIMHLRGDQRYYLMINGDSDYDVVPSDPERLIGAMEKIAPHFEISYLTVMDRIRGHDELQVLWARARGAWAILDQYVRIQFLEQSIPWFDPTIDAELLRDMQRQGNPIEGISKVLGISPLWVPPLNVVGALELLQAYITMDRNSLTDTLTLNTSAFGYNGVAFSPHAEEAADYVIGLRRRVDAITASGWPASAFVD